MKKNIYSIHTILAIARACAVVAVALIVTAQGPVAALTPAERRLKNRQNIVYIGGACVAETTSPTGSDVIAAGKDVEEKVVNYSFAQLTGDGIAKEDAAAQAAGIAGNFWQESTMNPAANIEPMSANDPAHGLAQWEGGRWTNLQKFLADYNTANANKPGFQPKKLTDVQIQLDFMWHELKGSEASRYAKFRLTKTPAEAARVWSVEYERPSVPMMENRIRYAQESYGRHAARLLGAPPASTPGTTPVTESTGGCGGGSASFGSCDSAADDAYCFPVAPQTKRNYTNLPCNNKARNYTDDYGNSASIQTCHHDKSPAFDLFYGTDANGAGGKDIYAITKGKVVSVNRKYCNPKEGGGCASYQGTYCNSIQIRSSTDNYYYWHGHVLAKKELAPGYEFTAGERLGVIAPQEFGPMCWGGAPHLHIDRGCKDGNTYRPGGSPGCRDPGFLPLLKQIWEGLPEE